MVVWLLLVSVLVTGALSQTVICPLRDYDMHQDQQYCYRYAQTPTDYFTANRTCVREGASMVYIENDSENIYIANTYFMGRGNVEFWIGLDDIENEGTFRWVNRSVSTMYTNWVDGNPTGRNRENLDCVKFTSSSEWDVHLNPCGTSHLPFICKMSTCIQSLINEDFCEGQEPTLPPAEGVAIELIVGVVIAVLVVIIIIVTVIVCVLLWRFNNDAFQRYVCCCVTGKNTSTVHSLQQENERLRKQISENRVSVSGRFSHAGELSGVPDGRGGVLPTIKQVPSFSPTIPEEYSFSRGRPPPLSLQRPNSRVTPARGLPSYTPVTTPGVMFTNKQTPPIRPGRQSAPPLIGRAVPTKVAPVKPIPEVKGQEDSGSSDNELFMKEEGGVADPRVTKEESEDPEVKDVDIDTQEKTPSD